MCSKRFSALNYIARYSEKTSDLASRVNNLAIVPNSPGENTVGKQLRKKETKGPARSPQEKKRGQEPLK